MKFSSLFLFLNSKIKRGRVNPLKRVFIVSLYNNIFENIDNIELLLVELDKNQATLINNINVVFKISTLIENLLEEDI